MAVSTFKTVQSFVQFLWNWFLTTKGQFVDQNTANIRASICAGCHANVPSGDVRKGCCGKAGNLAVMAVRRGIIGAKTTPSESRLLSCGICGCCLKISVWIPNSILLKPEDSNAYPAFCWKKKIEQNLDV